MKKLTLFFIANIIAINITFSQGAAINSSGSAAASSAILDVSSSSKGILIPRMTKAEKLLISGPATGLMIYQTNDTTGFWYFNSAKWVQAFASAGATASSTSVLYIYSGSTPAACPNGWTDNGYGNYNLSFNMNNNNTLYTFCRTCTNSNPYTSLYLYSSGTPAACPSGWNDAGSGNYNVVVNVNNNAILYTNCRSCYK